MASPDIAVLTDITGLLEFRTSNIFELTYEFNDAGSVSNPYKALKFYRYIGDLLDCSPPPASVEDSRVVLVTEITDIDLLASQATQSPGSQFTVDDNLATYDAVGSTTLRTVHGILDAVDDQQILHEIKYSRRQIHYYVETSKKGAPEDLPYVVVPYRLEDRVNAFASSTQVVHDVFHQEGDVIWTTKVPGLVASQLSRTAVDVSPIVGEDREYHIGPTGLGGNVWVSTRGRDLRRISLGHGLITGQVSLNHNGILGGGIGIINENGDLGWAPVDLNPKLYKVVNAFSFATDGSNSISTDWQTQLTYSTVQNIPIGFTGYGIAQIPTATQTQVVLTTKGNTGDDAQYIYTDSSGSFSGLPRLIGAYGITTTEDGRVWSTKYTTGGLFYQPSTGGGWTQLISNWGTGTSNGTGVGSDVSTKPTIFDPTGTTGVYRIGVGQDVPAGQYIRMYQSDGRTVNTNMLGNAGRGCGVDGENNWWALGKTQPVVSKFYSSINSDNDGANGGWSRFDSLPLANWPADAMNTREIKWFLTRNGHADDEFSGRFYTGATTTAAPSPKTIDGIESLYNAAYHGETLGTDLSAFDVGLDNITSVSWATGLSGDPGPQTAQEAWEWIVDGNIPGVGNEVGDQRLPVDANFSKTIFNANLPSATTGWYPIYPDKTTGIPKRHPSNIAKMWGKRLYEHAPHDNALQASRVATVLQYIRAWSNAFATPGVSYSGSNEAAVSKNIRGCRRFPHYIGGDVTLNPTGSVLDNAAVYNRQISISADLWNIYCYSDFTGSVLAASIGEAPVGVDRINPTPIAPTASIRTITSYQSSPLNEGSPQYIWKNVDNQSAALSAFDDTTATFELSTNPGTYIVTGINLKPGDFTDDYFTGTINPSAVLAQINPGYNYSGDYDTSVTQIYTYHDASSIGVPGDRAVNTRHGVVNAAGAFEPRAEVLTNPDVYNACASVNAESTSVSATVFERWPSARFYIESQDVSSARFPWLPPNDCGLVWGIPERYENTVLPVTQRYKDYIQLTVPVADNITTGIDPLSARVVDRSISRTFPLSTWYITISATNIWSPEIQSWISTGDTTYPYVTTATIDKLFYAPDTVNSITAGPSAILYDRLWRYGTYAFNLDVEAALSNTRSADKDGNPYTMTQYLSVAEFPPFANFWAISAQTVTRDYTDDSIAITNALVASAPSVHLPTSSAPFVSGYAPNLTVWFQDSSEAHTFPISAYNWNFGDYYDRTNNELTVYTDAYTGNFDTGCWRMTNFSASNSAMLVKDTEGHIVKHTYVMPGMYDVTLCAAASNTATQDCCARYIDNNILERFYVYVEEIPLTACIQTAIPISAAIGTGFTTGTNYTTYAPKLCASYDGTFYAYASCTTPGSFPICRLDFDWGDGTPIETITRSPYSLYTNLGTQITATSANISDVRDPREHYIPHTYTPNTTGAFAEYTMMVSAYACNTNTVDTASSKLIVYTDPTPGAVHLIKSRFIDSTSDKFYVFEGGRYGSEVMHIGLSGAVM